MGWAHGGIKRTQGDKHVSSLVRLMHPICEICQRRPSNQAMHIKGRRCRATRYSLDNILAGCSHCHRWQEENPIDFNDWLEARFPGRKQRILIKARGTLKNTKAIEQAVSKHYLQELRRLEADPKYKPESFN